MALLGRMVRAAAPLLQPPATANNADTVLLLQTVTDAGARSQAG